MRFNCRARHRRLGRSRSAACPLRLPAHSSSIRILRHYHPGWFALGYMSLVGHCIAYVTWFGAVERLPASVAAIGTMLVPVIGVVVSAIALHEPLGLSQIAALVFTVAGVALAARS